MKRLILGLAFVASTAGAFAQTTPGTSTSKPVVHQHMTHKKVTKKVTTTTPVSTTTTKTSVKTPAKK